MKLYNSNLSPFASRCRIQIYAKGLDVELVDAPGGTGSAAYKAINPTGKVPALEVDGAVIPESEVICEFLEDRFPEQPLRPANDLDRARMRVLAEMCDSYLVPSMLALFDQFPPNQKDQATIDRCFGEIDAGLDRIEAFMGKGPYAARRRAHARRLLARAGVLLRGAHRPGARRQEPARVAPQAPGLVERGARGRVGQARDGRDARGAAGPSLAPSADGSDRHSRSASTASAIRGTHRRRRRRDRPRRRGRRRRARLSHAAARAERLRQGHLEPLHQAHPRRRPLPAPGQRLAGARGAARARHPAPQRASPGARRSVRRAELRLVGVAVLRHRTSPLRPAGGQGRVRRLAAPLQGGDARAHADDRDRGSARRRPLLRRPVRRRAARHQPGDDGDRSRRRGAQLHGGDRAGEGGRHRARRRGARRRDRPRPQAAREGGGQRHRRLDRRVAPARRRGGGAADPPQPGRAHRARPALPSRRCGDHGAAHRRRARAVRDPLARARGGRHHRHADRRGDARAASAARRSSSSCWCTPRAT